MEKEQSVALLKLYKNLIQDRLLMLTIRDNLQKQDGPVSRLCISKLEEIDEKLTKQFEDPLRKKKFKEKFKPSTVISNSLRKRREHVLKPKQSKLKASTKCYLVFLSLVALGVSLAIVSYTGVKFRWYCIVALPQNIKHPPEKKSSVFSNLGQKNIDYKDRLLSKNTQKTSQPSALGVSQAQCSAPRDHSSKEGPCLSSPCLHPDAICIGNVTYECICPSPFTGQKCETNMDDCHSNPCQNGGKCEDKVSAYKCHCTVEYEGDHCEQLVGPCEDNLPCLNNGICNDISYDTYVCDCPLGYVGQICHVDMNECDSSPCAHGRTCTDGIDSYTCDCGPGYLLDNCQIDVNECASSPCLNGAYCEDGHAEYVCHCSPGYSGKHCEIEVNYCDSTPCYNGGTCVDRLDGYTCSCTPGYGFFHCDHDLNECEADSGHVLCEGGMCEDQGDGHHCYCGHGKDENADRTACVDVDRCTVNPCKNGGTCGGDTLHYNCTCDGPEFSGPICEWNTDDCFEVVPCGAAGTCSDTPTGYSCSCIDGYTGTVCDATINYCESSPCQNGGTCVDKVLGYKCLCESGYNPLHCEDVDYCAAQPCHNDGTCSTDGRSFTCKCTTSWTGDTCSESRTP